MSHKFDILIPYAHDHGHLEGCLKAVIRNSYDYRIRVLNNGAPGTCPLTVNDVIETSPLGTPIIKYQVYPNVGGCKAHNILLAYSTAPYIVILNDDAIVEPGWLGALQKVVDMDGIGLASAMVSNPGTHMSKDRWEKKPYERFDPAAMGFNDDGIAALDLPDVSTVCVMIKREVFQEMGYFSEKFTFGWDTEYCYRLRRAGYTLGLSTETCVEHYPHSTRYQFDPDEGGEIRTREKEMLKEQYPEFCK